jgi:hypothetical protein
VSTDVIAASWTDGYCALCAIYTYKRLTEAAFRNVGQYTLADRDLFARVTMLTTYRAASQKHRRGGGVNKGFPIQRTLGLSVWTVPFIASRKTNVQKRKFAFRVVRFDFFLGFYLLKKLIE